MSGDPIGPPETTLSLGCTDVCESTVRARERQLIFIVEEVGCVGSLHDKSHIEQ